MPLQAPFRGGGDQATAPKIARQLPDTPPDIPLTLTDATETYTLGAAIRWAWTCTTPATTRKTADPHVTPADVLEDIATGRRRIPTTTPPRGRSDRR
ncbi:hypothetical protein ACIBSV_36220 [Embleya sp. NPDC050154]|uniref:hypothetical protein n=1 Tax=Embleya sp. NPDC050154 TaxID=3363988 RepID=UPI00378756D8